MRVAGIDFSSLAIDVVTIDLDDLAPPQWNRYPLTGQDAFERTRNVRSSMPPMSAWDDTLAIGIEEPTGKFKPGLGYRVQGAVLACLPSEVLVQPWPPAAWRKAVGLPGNASKEDVFTFAIRQINQWDPTRATWGLAVPNDATDAYCIALATRQALELDNHLPKEAAA